MRRRTTSISSRPTSVHCPLPHPNSPIPVRPSCPGQSWCYCTGGRRADAPALPAEVAVDHIPELLGEIEGLREPTTSAAAQSSVRRTSVRFVDSSRPEGPRPEGPCPGEPP